VGQAKPYKPVAIVVEDDSLQSSLAATLLEEARYEVVECRTAEVALAAIARNDTRVALVFTDVRLGDGMDGLELATIVRQRYPRATVVITSAHIGERRNQLAAQTYFIPKPWLPLDLLEAAERARPRVFIQDPDAAHLGRESIGVRSV
jgi:DNA-binding NtrC family response regulator